MIDALDWFIEFPDNTFDSLQSIIDAFDDKRNIKAKIKVKETKETENVLIKELTQIVKGMQLNMEVNQAQLIKNMEFN